VQTKGGFRSLAAAVAAMAALATGAAHGQSTTGSAPPTISAFSFTQIMDEIAALSNQMSQTLAQQETAALNAIQLQARDAQQQANQILQGSSSMMAMATVGLVLSVAGAATGMATGAGETGPATTRSYMSCPVFAGSGTLLVEDSCVWGKAGGQRTTQFGLTTDGAGFQIGGQYEVAPGWFLGGGLAAGSSWMQAGGVASLGRSFGASAVLKHVNGPWLLAGAVAAGTTATHVTRSSSDGFVMQADSNAFQGGLTLRVAYAAAFDGWYLRPRLDVDGLYRSMGPVQEYGQSPVALSVGGAAKASVAIAPAIEVGGRIAAGSVLGDGTILRPYLIGGVAVLPDNNVSVYTGFAGPLAPFGGFVTTFVGPPLLGTVEAGLQLYREKGLEMKAEYRLAGGQSYFSQGLALRGAWHF
jgi:hypothetical protein